MSLNNPALVLISKGVIRVEDTPIPEPGPGEVQIKIDSVGICGTDVHFWQDGSVGEYIVKEPIVLGHEPAGTVSKVGSGVLHLNIGDRVAIEPGVTCHHCEFCKAGRYNLCPLMLFAGTPPTHGTLRRYHVHRAEFCFKLPDNLSFEEGALCQPLTIGIHSCRRAGVKLGDTVLICGAGPIGLVCLVTAKAMGAGFIAITDISQNRLNVAKQFGATHTFLTTNKDSKIVAEKIIKELGRKPNISIECSGAELSIQTAFYATQSGGVVQIVGIGHSTVALPIIHAATHEIDVRGTWGNANCYPIAIDMLSSSTVDLKPMITHRFKLRDAVEAFNVAKNPNSGSMKVMINCSED